MTHANTKNRKASDDSDGCSSSQIYTGTRPPSDPCSCHMLGGPHPSFQIKHRHSPHHHMFLRIGSKGNPSQLVDKNQWFPVPFGHQTCVLENCPFMEHPTKTIAVLDHTRGYVYTTITYIYIYYIYISLSLSLSLCPSLSLSLPIYICKVYVHHSTPNTCDYIGPSIGENMTIIHWHGGTPSLSGENPFHQYMWESNPIQLKRVGFPYIDGMDSSGSI